MTPAGSREVVLHPSVRKVDLPHLAHIDRAALRVFGSVLNEIAWGMESGGRLPRRPHREGRDDPLAEVDARLVSFGSRIDAQREPYAALIRLTPPGPHDTKAQVQVLAVGPKDSGIVYTRGRHRSRDLDQSPRQQPASRPASPVSQRSYWERTRRQPPPGRGGGLGR